jgi:peptide/nickel transport system permease protein
MRRLIVRLLSTIVTLIAISVVAFVVIQLPPGDYATTYMAKLEALGERLDAQSVEHIRNSYGLDKPMVTRYFLWIWRFAQGDWGYSFQTSQPVKEMIVERIPLTISIELLTLLFVWIISIPVAVYSSIRQYSVGDYVCTVLGFLGIATPNFVLAVVIMWLAFLLFGTTVSGINSPEFVSAPWSFAKMIDSAQHLWVILVVNGTAAMAGQIRILRASLLDELNQPYVTTARAMGMSEGRLLIKYPLRVALNPMISHIGLLLPQLISASTITAIVLSVPTVAPMLYEALLVQDIYLAGGIIMLLSVLAMVGTIVSDVLLYVVDPRVRYSA